MKQKMHIDFSLGDQEEATTVPVSMSRADLIEALRTDCVTVLAFYLGDKLTLDVPAVHIEIWDEFLEYLQMVNDPRFVVGRLKKLFCVPRGHAKSTLAKLAVILFLRYSKLSFVVYASNTKSIAINAIKDIVGWFDSPQDRDLFNHVCFREKANESDAIWIIHIGLPDGTIKRCILKALGADAQVRGMLIESRRPELLVIDDCEDLSTASSEQTQKRLDEWLFGSLIEALAKKALVVMLGNMIKKTTAIARLSKLKTWNPTVFGAIVRDKKTGVLVPLWPGLYTTRSLLAGYAEARLMGTGHVWAHEMMNLTAEQVFGVDMANAVQVPVVNPDQIEAGCIVLDPAFGQNSWNDDSAITVHVILKKEFGFGPVAGIPHVVQSVVGRLTEEQLLDELLALSFYWGINTWCIEAVAAQKLLIPYFTVQMKLRLLNPEAIAFVPITGGKEAKASRILAFKNSVSSGAYGVSEACPDLFEKLVTYDPTSTAHDDEVDSGALGMIAWASAGETIRAGGTMNVAMAVTGIGTRGRRLSEFETVPH